MVDAIYIFVLIKDSRILTGLDEVSAGVGFICSHPLACCAIQVIGVVRLRCCFDYSCITTAGTTIIVLC